MCETSTPLIGNVTLGDGLLIYQHVIQDLAYEPLDHAVEMSTSSTKSNMSDSKLLPEVAVHENATSGSGSGSREQQHSLPQSDDPVSGNRTRTLSHITTRSTVEYKVYKRRFFGLFQLVLLNIVVSWDWIAFAPVSDTAATYFNTTESLINWLSTAFLFAFVATTPFDVLDIA